MSLFEETYPPKPLAERMRPKSLEEILGQEEAMKLLNAYINRGDMPSVVFSGPPGCGKTTMSRLMASLLGWEGRSLNATSASVKDIRDLAAEAKEIWRQLEKRSLLFIDEIHRLNKAQQDVLLPIVEAGTLILAGSTTENPFFALNKALRSRVQLIQLQPLSVENVRQGMERAVKLEEASASEDALAWVATRVSGDLRLAYTTLESAALMARSEGRAIEVDDVRLCLTRTQLAGDRKGDNHYDLASAFQKSLRGSDANAAAYYLTRFLETGEDPRFIARRLLVTASEDVGNADPRAFLIASQAFRAVEVLGLPECKIPLAQATLYVARAPKSNEAIKTLGATSQFLKTRPLDPVPAHLRDSHYQGAAELGHGKGYRYTHDYPGQRQTFLPENIKDQVFAAESPKKSQGEQTKTKADDDSLDKLLAFLKLEYDKDTWFEIDAEVLAEKIQWPRERVRAAMNALVQERKLAFKRLFKL